MSGENSKALVYENKLNSAATLSDKQLRSYHKWEEKSKNLFWVKVEVLLGYIPNYIVTPNHWLLTHEWAYANMH